MKFPSDLIRQSEAGDLAGVGRGTVHAAIKHEHLTGYNVAGIILVSEKEVRRRWPNGKPLKSSGRRSTQ